MRTKELKRASVALGCVCAAVLAAGGGTFELDTSGDWNTCSNWTLLAGMPAACYPSTGDDDAIIPVARSTWIVWLVTDTIDNLTIEDDVAFDAVSGTPTLTVDSVTISGSAVVTITGGATIATN